MKRLLMIALAMTAAACGQADETTREIYRDPSLSADLPFSSAVVVGDTIYLSGEIGRAPGTVQLVDGGAGAQTHQIFANYKATLDRLGSGLDDIVKCTVFLENMNEYAAMNEAYAAAFPGDKPARSTMGVDGLALGAAVEIECLAVKS